MQAWPLLVLLVGAAVLVYPAEGEDGLELGEPPIWPAPTVREWQAAPRLIASPPIQFSVTVTNREEVRNFFNTVYAASANAALGWTGHAETCDAGTTDAAFRDLAALRINWYRAMAGVPAWIVFDQAYSTNDQAAALMMSVNNALSHTPPATWLCYTANGANAAGKSNLALGQAGPDAVNGDIEDFGANNDAVGHRRWLLLPQTETMGTGDVPSSGGARAANAIWVLDSRSIGNPRPATRESYVCWPPPGYVPYPVVYARWSFSYPNADFSSASVVMTSNGVPVAVTLEPVRTGYAENTLAWRPATADITRAANWPRPASDTVYGIAVNNVTISGTSRSYSYTVAVFDPQTAGADTVLPVVSGPDMPVTGQANGYSFSAVPGATGHQWRRTLRGAWTAVEGGENGLGDFMVQTAADYNPLVSSPPSFIASGAKSLHLAHTAPADQSLTYRRLVLPGAGGALQFKSRLWYATTTQEAHVQVSVNEGGAWQDIYVQAGTDAAGESSFATRTLPLASFADRPVLVRFLYRYAGSTYYPQAETGWFFDDITFTGVEELTQPVIAEVPTGASFVFAPASAGAYALAVRAKVYGAYPLEWGPAKRVATMTTPLPVLTLIGPPTVVGDQVRVGFRVANYRAGLGYRLGRSPRLPGNWAVDPNATVQELIPGTQYRFTTLAPTQAATFYRVSTW
jgi:hypothetical protein